MVVLSLKTYEVLDLAIAIRRFCMNKVEDTNSGDFWFLQLEPILVKMQKALRKYMDKNVIKDYRNEVRKSLKMELIE